MKSMFSLPAPKVTGSTQRNKSPSYYTRSSCTFVSGQHDRNPMTAPLTPAEQQLARDFFAMLTGEELHQALVMANAPISHGTSRFATLLHAEIERRRRRKGDVIPESYEGDEPPPDGGTPVIPFRRR